jgi:biotin carboxyl carrier protein
MAEVTNGPDGRDAATGVARPPGPRAGAIRVSLAPSTPVDGVEPITVEPAHNPPVMLEASSGAGPLGGFAIEPSLAQARTTKPEPQLLVDGQPTRISLRRLDAEHARLVAPDGEPPRSLLLLPPEPSSSSVVGGVRREVVVDGWRFEVEIESAARAALRERARRGRAEAGHSGPTEVHAIIPGVVVGASVAAGDEVVAGQQLLVVEAMKMQNELRAPRDGTIDRVAVGVGQTIEVGDLLLVIT